MIEVLLFSFSISIDAFGYSLGFGSKNIVKLNATKEVLEPFGFEVIGVDVDSLVSAQPKCDEETMNGAYNRALALEEKSFRIGLEAGIEMLNDQMYLTNFGVLIDPEDNVFRAGGTRIVLPKELRRTMRIKEGDSLEIYSENIEKVLTVSEGIVENHSEHLNRHLHQG